jgi:8-oxo-dGTP diphosphatase
VPMGKAARAIIIEDDKMLVMHRNKYGSEYFTLVGGRANENETMEQALAREIREETGLTITKYRLVFYEVHPEPYNQQYVYLCEVAPHGEVAIQDYSEEGFMNKLDANMHHPVWVSTRNFHNLHFRTPQLHSAILKALKNGFPEEAEKL